MKILLTGGGTGGHIFPLLAVGRRLRQKSQISNSKFQIRYYGPVSPYDEVIEKEGIVVEHILGAKLRRYFSLLNLVDIPKLGISLLQSIWKVWRWRPDVCFSKGGSGALSILYACHLLKVPIVLHESDTVPGLTNRIASRWATKYLKAWDGAGIPLRQELLDKINLDQRQAKHLLGSDPNRLLVLVIGGSQGSQRINKFISDNRSDLLKKYQILSAINFSAEKMATAYAAADVVVSRSGSIIFEIAAFGKPSILIPLPESANDHQRINAETYAKTGAAVVIEEKDLNIEKFKTTLEQCLANKEKMFAAAKKFAKPNAAEVVVKEITSY